jgi:hypothetical protein
MECCRIFGNLFDLVLRFVNCLRKFVEIVCNPCDIFIKCKMSETWQKIMCNGDDTYESSEITVCIWYDPIFINEIKYVS